MFLIFLKDYVLKYSEMFEIKRRNQSTRKMRTYDINSSPYETNVIDINYINTTLLSDRILDLGSKLFVECSQNNNNIKSRSLGQRESKKNIHK